MIKQDLKIQSHYITPVRPRYPRFFLNKVKRIRKTTIMEFEHATLQEVLLCKEVYLRFVGGQNEFAVIGGEAGNDTGRIFRSNREGNSDVYSLVLNCLAGPGEEKYVPLITDISNSYLDRAFMIDKRIETINDYTIIFYNDGTVYFNRTDLLEQQFGAISKALTDRISAAEFEYFSK